MYWPKWCIFFEEDLWFWLLKSETIFWSFPQEVCTYILFSLLYLLWGYCNSHASHYFISMDAFFTTWQWLLLSTMIPHETKAVRCSEGLLFCPNLHRMLNMGGSHSKQKDKLAIFLCISWWPQYNVIKLAWVVFSVAVFMTKKCF